MQGESTGLIGVRQDGCRALQLPNGWGRTRQLTRTPADTLQMGNIEGAQDENIVNCGCRAGRKSPSLLLNCSSMIFTLSRPFAGGCVGAGEEILRETPSWEIGK